MNTLFIRFYINYEFYTQTNNQKTQITMLSKWKLSAIPRLRRELFQVALPPRLQAASLERLQVRPACSNRKWRSWRETVLRSRSFLPSTSWDRWFYKLVYFLRTCYIEFVIFNQDTAHTKVSTWVLYVLKEYFLCWRNNWCAYCSPNIKKKNGF